MGNSIVPYQGNQIIRTMDDAERAAQAMAQSGFFQDSRNAAQAVVKILAGQELGFGPFASMKGVYIIQGGPSLSANLMAAAVKKSGRYNYRVSEMTDKTCTITFYENGQEIGASTFTAEDARKAGTKNMDKFPRNMLFARAMSNGCRWYCPDVFNGNTVYTPEELGAEVNEEGEVIDVGYKQTVTEPEKRSEPEQKVEAPTNGASQLDKYIEEIAAEKKISVDKIKGYLNFSNEGFEGASKEIIVTWLGYYAEARKPGPNPKTPQEAGVYADEETMKALNLGAIA